MKLKLFISMVFMIQFSACGVFETQLNDSIQVNNQGIESRIQTLENEIDKLKKELDQVTSIKHDLNPSIPKEKSELRAQYDNSENEKKEFESSFELLRKGDYVSAEIALREHINSFPMDPILMMQNSGLAESLFSQKNYNEALGIFNQIIHPNPGF
jgi:Uncharacterized protein conserved in bacteria